MAPSSPPQTPDKKKASIIHPPRRRGRRRRSNKHTATRSSSLELLDDEFAFESNTLDKNDDRFRQPRRALSFAKPKPAMTKSSSHKADGDNNDEDEDALVGTKPETEPTTGQGEKGKNQDIHVKREPSAKANAKTQASPTMNDDDHVKPSSVESGSGWASGKKLSKQSPQVVTPEEQNRKRKGNDDDDDNNNNNGLVDTSDDEDHNDGRPQKTKSCTAARRAKTKPRFRVVFRTDENGNLVRQRVEAQAEYGLFDSEDDDHVPSRELDLDTDPEKSDSKHGSKKDRSPKQPPRSNNNIQSAVEDLVDEAIPSMLSVEEQEKAFNDIKELHDVALQAVLFQENFCFVLKRYQFLAVRRMAGLPPLFPLHCGSRVGEPRKATMSDAKFGLNRPENLCRTRGILCADEMGLGKTVESVAAAILRNSWRVAEREEIRPTMIVTPNDEVGKQWIKTLLRNGVPANRIFVIKKSTRLKKGVWFFLMTRYKLQSSVKRVLNEQANESLISDRRKRSSIRGLSPLFPFADLSILDMMKLQYLDETSHRIVSNTVKEEDETIQDCVTRLARICARRSRDDRAVFEMLFIDEAHLLKNLATFWGIGAALLGVHAARSICVTGTPYNNRTQDLASLMTFINPAVQSAHNDFWIQATSTMSDVDIVRKVTAWRNTYLIRRRKEDELKDELPTKTIKSELVPQYKAELFLYDRYEALLVEVLKDFAELNREAENPVVREQLKSLFTVLMSHMSCMRMANIHSMIPGGREYTKLFSPSRRHLRVREERRDVCICCTQAMHPFIPVPSEEGETLQSGTGHNNVPVDIVLQEEGEVRDDADDVPEFQADSVDEEEELVLVPANLCKAHGGVVKHYIHQKCIPDIHSKYDGFCPRCSDIEKRALFELPNEQAKWCQKIGGGFTGSSKINHVVKWYKEKVPNGEKVLILSFFKGGLDLLEGIFAEDLEINCARFDGDVSAAVRSAELERFKKDPACLVLFATVQSGGVGLDIVQANHVFFLDRWYNPFVHSQAEDRIFRIGQERPCHIVYFDCGATLDEGMALVNKFKKENSAVLLADGFEIGIQAGSITYQELSGLFSRVVSTIRGHRLDWTRQNEDASNHNCIPPCGEERLKQALEDFQRGRPPRWIEGGRKVGGSGVDPVENMEEGLYDTEEDCSHDDDGEKEEEGSKTVVDGGGESFD